MKALRSLTCIAFWCSLGSASAQIPNGGFEDWSDQGEYLDPTHWLTYNDIETLWGPVLTVERGSPGAVGSHHAVITSRQVPEGTMVVQGWMSAEPFAYAQRPVLLTGKWQYGIQPTDTGEVQVALTKWNTASASAELVASGTMLISGTASEWTIFALPFNYLSSETPDTARVQFAASKNFSAPVAGSFMKVDDLAFSGVVGMDGTEALRPQLYPSPTSDVLHITSSGHMSSLTLVDIAGRIMEHRAVSASRATFDVIALPAGRYFVHVQMNDRTTSIHSFVKY